jgi:hypothetical protein
MSDGQAHDAWHQHTTEEGRPQEEHGAYATTKALGITFIIMVFGVIAVILVLIIYFNSFVSRFSAERQEGTAMMAPAYNDRLAAQRHLDSFGWLDRDAGTAHIPLPNAIDRVVEEYRNNGPRAQERDTSDAQG